MYPIHHVTFWIWRIFGIAPYSYVTYKKHAMDIVHSVLLLIIALGVTAYEIYLISAEFSYTFVAFLCNVSLGTINLIAIIVVALTKHDVIIRLKEELNKLDTKIEYIGANIDCKACYRFQFKMIFCYCIFLTLLIAFCIINDSALAYFYIGRKIFLYVILIMVFIQFCTYVQILENYFKEINAIINNSRQRLICLPDSSNVVYSFDSIIALYSTLQVCVELVNSYFPLQFSLFIISWSLTTVYYFLLPSYTVALLNIFLDCSKVAFFIVCLEVCQRTLDEIKKSSHITGSFNINWQNNELLSMADTFELLLTCNDIQFTMYGLYSLNRSFLFTLASWLIMFISVAAQVVAFVESRKNVKS